MIRRVIYIVLITGVLFSPVKRIDVGSLQPIEVICVYHSNQGITVETDTGDVGQGNDLHAALIDLMNTAPGVVYLDTAEFLLVSEDLDAQIELMKDKLKGSTKVVAISGRIDLQNIDSYLRAHGDFPKIKKWKRGDKLPVLTSEKISAKVENKA